MDTTKLDQHQTNTLNQFRSAVKDCKLPDSSDSYLLRWLIARNFDIPKAEKMLRTSLEWRRQYRIDTILENFNPPKVLQNYYAAGHVGVDKAGNPLWIVRYGRIDMRGILQSVKKRDYYDHVFYLVEKSMKFLKCSSTIMAQSTTIFDMECFSMRQLSYKPMVEVALQVVQAYEANYPEFLHRVYVINAPEIFSLAYALIKPFLNDATAQKVKVFGGSDSSRWKKAILEDVDADQLPVQYGGTMTDPDGNPQCITKVNLGGSVPKSYYFNNQPKLNNTYHKNLTVSSRSKQQLEFEVKIPESTLRWEFYCKEGDIGFAVYKKNDSDKCAVVPKNRVDCHIIPEEGEIYAEPGQYIVEFDNTFSYLRSKIIRYTISIDLLPKSKMEIS